MRRIIYILTHLCSLREENGGRISLFFDCSKAGLSNMDIDFMRFMIGTMEQYIPDS